MAVASLFCFIWFEKTCHKTMAKVDWTNYYAVVFHSSCMLSGTRNKDKDCLFKTKPHIFNFQFMLLFIDMFLITIHPHVTGCPFIPTLMLCDND